MSCNQQSPGPADFKLRPLVGFKDHDVNSQKARAPEYTMAEKFKIPRGVKTPGPVDVGPFNRFGKYPTIGGIMYGRYKSQKIGQAPGPASYNATPSTLYHWPNSSQFTMGMRTKLKGLNVGPGPVGEMTSLDIYKNRAPKYPMFSKIRDFKEGKTPGPSEYNKAGDDKIKTMSKSPAYTMRGERLSSKKGKGPGPANYNLMDYNPFDRAPTHRIAGKHKSSGCVGIFIHPLDNC